MAPNTLPEGTDTIIGDSAVDRDFSAAIDSSGAIPMDNGAQADAASATDSAGAAAQGAKATLKDAASKAGEKAQGLKGQATDKLRAYAVSGKDAATGKLQEFAKLADDAAAQVDEKLGPQYGDYARQAAQTISSLAANLDGKDVDELFDQGRDLVRKSPAVAIGIAAALGFVVARVAKAGIDPVTGGTTAPTPAKPENEVVFSPDAALGSQA